MAERPILFSAPMVRAILAGQKTQTRRVLKTQPVGTPTAGQASLTRAMTKPVVYAMWDEAAPDGSTCCICPYGVPGDRLWVRETHAIVPRTAYRCSEGVQQVLRPDDDHDAAIFREGQDGFELLWSSINGRESWDADPWVWVVEFKKLES